MTGFVVTALYVPGDRPDRFDKATAAGADVVILDLEDAVAPSGKVQAREAVSAWLDGGSMAEIQVRINPFGSTDGEADLRAAAAWPLDVGLRLPKVESAADVAVIAERLPGRNLHPLVETAVGVEALSEIARAAGVATLGLGEADLRSELGFEDDQPLDWIRTRLVVAARAAGLPAPLMSAWTDLNDEDGLRRSCRAGRRRGFVGRTAIHPRQLPVIREAFRPSADEIADARAVLDALTVASNSGRGVAVLPGGRMVDAAMRAAATRTLRLIGERID